MERGQRQVAQRMDNFFREFKAAGGMLDLLVLDLEKGFHWNRVRGNGPEWLRAIQTDPRFPSLAEDLGFDDLSLIKWGNDYSRKWDSVMRRRLDATMNAAVYGVARKYYPNLKASNYGSYVVEPEHAQPRSNSVRNYYETAVFGTHNSRQFYAFIASVGERKLDGRSALGDSPYAGVLLNINQLRSIMRSSTKPIHPWVAAYSWTDTGSNLKRRPVVSNTPYYDELMYHLALHGLDTFIYWNAKAWKPEQDPMKWAKSSDDLRLNRLLEVVNTRIAGVWKGAATSAPISWDADVIATGLEVDDRFVWRITFKPGIDSINASIDGRTITIEREANGVGAWFIHRADQEFSLNK